MAVLLVVPLGVTGAIMATLWRGLNNDVFFQVGLLTTVGLSAKNAILIVEFAKENYEQGMDLVTATVTAAHQRLRPILMTSLAFVLELGAEEARAEEPDRHPRAAARNGLDFLARVERFQVSLEFLHVLGKMIGAGYGIAAERPRGRHVGPGRAAQPEIDATGIKRGEGPELLGDNERRMVGEHHASRPDADGLRTAGHVADHHGGGGAGDAGHIVMFGQPVTAVTPAFRVLGEIEGAVEGVGRRGALRDGGKIEDGKGNHGFRGKIGVSIKVAETGRR